MKKKQFKDPYIGIEYFKEKALLYGTNGEATHILKIDNLVEEYASKEDLYVNYHSVLLNIIKVLGDNYHIQKLDVFSQKVYKAEETDNFLQQSYEKWFDGRIGVNIDTYLCITKLYEGSYSEKKFEDFIDKIDKVAYMLREHTSVYSLSVEETKLFTMRILALNFEDKSFTIPNMSPNDEAIGRGKMASKVLSLIDIDTIDLPSTISPFVYTNNEQIKSFPIDLMSFLLKIKNYKTLIYSQVIQIPNQIKEMGKLKTKQKRHSGIPDPANDICVEDIQLLLEDVAKEGQLVVNAHFSLVIASNTTEELEACENEIVSKLFDYSITPSDNSYNQLELYRAVLPGNSTELKKYDWFLTTSHAALCFFFKETQLKDDESSFYLKYTNREGLPLKFDPEEKPQADKRIGNRNSFVLGPSGSGKSFLTNSIVEQKLNYNYDVVIVDTGDSYSGISGYFGAKYIQWKDEKPITMNPFLLKKEELNIEKKQFLKSLILLCWKGAGGDVSSIEVDVITDVINSYYNTYFREDVGEVEDYSIEEVIKILEDEGVDTKRLYQEAEEDYLNEKKETVEAYKILGLNVGDNIDKVKRQYKKLAKELHPDNNTDVEDNKRFIIVHESYSRLLLELKKKELVVKGGQEIEKYNNLSDDDLLVIQKKFESSLIVKFKQLKTFEIKELNFNSFFDFSLYKIPTILERYKLTANTERFALSEYTYLLKKFYKGGEFELILNEQADASLFTEQFIVFEIDNIKEHPILFPIVTLIIIDTFIQKMRFRKNRKKQLIIEEAWKAIASPVMAGNILYLYKTARKFQASVTVVTQELDDILGNEIVKSAIVNNSDSIILLDQSKFKDNFSEIAKLLSLNEIEQRKIFTINKLDNTEGRGQFKEAYWGLGGVGRIIGVEVSPEQYFAYTTEKREKEALVNYVKSNGGSYQVAIASLVADLGKVKDKIQRSLFFDFINIYEKPLDDVLMNFFDTTEDKASAFKKVTSRMRLEEKTFYEILNQN